MSKFKKYWLFAVIGTLAASFYPLYMGFRVICDMIAKGTVMEENYPKYIIPYTSISVAVIVAVLIMPLLMKYVKKHSFLIASALSLVMFFTAELLLESKVIITSTIDTTLESWQMFMCYVPPEGFITRTWTPIDILIGDYSPTFKIHFYMISVILIISITNCLYGFGQIIRKKDHSRRKALTVQSICTALFLGLCILACFTAFFRDGELTVSPLSAFLMILFFIVLGVTAGSYLGSFLLGKKKTVSVLLPSVAASLITLAMYIGEMFLLSGHLYQLGSGFLFNRISGIVLAPIDILVILSSGVANAVICHCLNRKKKE
ncbi:MAG: hypothetical protein J1E05_04855 [Eubacterium sp.]|nr:hypothetical protein [Eubacterium sp.]